MHSDQSTVLLPWRHLNTVVLINFEKLKSISNIFQEIHNFLVLMDPVILCVYLRTIDRHFSYQGNVGHPTSELLKIDLVQTLDAFRNSLCDFLLSGRHLSLFWCFLRLSFPLPKWCNCCMVAIKIHNIAILCDDIMGEWSKIRKSLAI